MGITHSFISLKPDGADSSLTQPSNWNAPHLIDNGTITTALLADNAVIATKLADTAVTSTKIQDTAVTFSKFQDISTQQVLGRNTAGSGSPEQVTASQILDWVSNTNGVLLTRTAGSWGAITNVSSDSGDLVFAENTSPAAPATGKVKLFGTSSGGRQMIAALAPAGAKMTLQPFLARKNIAMWLPKGNTTSVDSIGANGPVVTGTPTIRTATSANYATGIKRVGYVSAPGAGLTAGVRNTVAQYWRGNAANAGGFHVVFRWMISDASIVTTGRTFVGLQASTAAPTDVNPSSLANIIGVGTDANDTVLQLYAAGAVAQARTSLGASFPANTTNADVYELALYCPPNGSTITYQITRLNTGNATSGTISDVNKLPSSTTFLTQQMWRTNGSTAAAVGIDLISFYAETDL